MNTHTQPASRPRSGPPPSAPESVGGTPSGAEVARRFLEAIEALDFEALEACLAPDVWFRGLLPKRVQESNTSAELVAAFRGWFDRPGARVESTAHHTMEGREHVRYRCRLLPRFAPDQFHVLEQTGYCRVRDGKISRLDIICTGHHPC